MNFLPDAHTAAVYGLACLVLFVTPGPDMSLWLSRTISSGTRVGIATVLGTGAGSLVHTLLAAFGLSALLAASATAFTVLKVLGAVYLLWLAWRALRAGTALGVGDAGRRERPGRSFVSGALVNLANPKVVLFFVTFLPQFVSADDPDAVGKLLFLGLLLDTINTVLGIGLVLSARRVVEVLRRRPRIGRVIDYVFAGVFGGFAMSILAAQGR